jgi:hypothetical protein
MRHPHTISVNRLFRILNVYTGIVALKVVLLWRGVARLRDWCVARLRDCCVARLRDCCVARLRDRCVARLRDFCVIVALHGCVIDGFDVSSSSLFILY